MISIEGDGCGGGDDDHFFVRSRYDPWLWLRSGHGGRVYCAPEETWDWRYPALLEVQAVELAQYH